MQVYVAADNSQPHSDVLYTPFSDLNLPCYFIPGKLLSGIQGVGPGSVPSTPRYLIYCLIVGIDQAGSFLSILYAIGIDLTVTIVFLVFLFLTAMLDMQSQRLLVESPQVGSTLQSDIDRTEFLSQWKKEAIPMMVLLPVLGGMLFFPYEKMINDDANPTSQYIGLIGVTTIIFFAIISPFVPIIDLVNKVHARQTTKVIRNYYEKITTILFDGQLSSSDALDRLESLHNNEGAQIDKSLELWSSSITTGLVQILYTTVGFTALLLFGPVASTSGEYTPSWFRSAFAGVNFFFCMLSLKTYLDSLSVPYGEFHEKIRRELRNAKKLKFSLEKFDGDYAALEGWIESQEVSVKIGGVVVDHMLPNKIMGSLVSTLFLVGLVIFEKGI